MLNLLIAFGMFVLANHELGVVGMIGGDMEIAKTGTTAAFLAEFGGKFHNFGHGVVHGVIATVLFAIPFVGYDTIFSKKSGKYFLVNMGFWLISLCLVGGVVSQWGAMPLN